MAKRKKVVMKLIHAGEVIGGEMRILCGKTHQVDGAFNLACLEDTKLLVMADEHGGLCPRCALILSAYARGWNGAVRMAAIASAAPEELAQNAPSSGTFN